MCVALDALSFTIFLIAILACLLNPARLLLLTLRQHAHPMTDFFLSHYQAEANDAMKMLALSIEASGHSAWYDQEADQITPTAMLNGVSSQSVSPCRPQVHAGRSAAVTSQGGGL